MAVHLSREPRMAPQTMRKLSSLPSSRTLLVTLLTCSFACHARETLAEPPKRPPGVRKVDREVRKPVPIDEALFSPLLLEPNTPEPLPDAYKAFAAGRTHEARRGFEAFLKASPTHALSPRVRFLLAYLEDQAGRKDVAAALYEAAAQDYPLLADYALYYGARAAYAAQLYPKTLELGGALSPGSRFTARAAYLRGVSLHRLGRTEEAIDALQAWARRWPRSNLLPEVQLDLAIALEDAGRTEDAARLFHTLRMRHPGTSTEQKAEDAIKRLSRQLPPATRDKLFAISTQDRLHRAQALYEKHRSDTVVEEINTLLTSAAAPKAGQPAWCDAVLLRAQAWTKLRKHKESSSNYDEFLAGCPKDKRVILALFQLGRARWNIDQDQEAMRAFKRLWTEFPNHSYADDAVLYAARIERSNEHPKAARDLLDFQIKHFPQGDMLGDAYWMRFQEDYAAKRYKEALAYADTIGKRNGESDLYTRGRLAYFRARTLEHLGRPKEALDAFAQVARDVPMSFYALLALNRLRDLDPQRFQRELERLAADAPGGQQGWTLDPPHIADDSGFKRGVELLRLGLFQDARAEFADLRDRFPDKDALLWVLALLFDHAGAYHLSHDIPRREIASFGTAYPVGPMRRMYELAYPRPFHDDVARWSKERNIPEALTYAIMREESGFNPQIESWANACGLMQLMVPTARDMAAADALARPAPAKLDRDDLFQPELNVRLGTRFLSTLTQAYKQHPSVAIASYNGGQGNIDRWLRERGDLPFDLWVEEIPFGQTRNYTKRVTMTLWIYQWLYGPDAQPDAPAHEARMVHLPLKLPPPSL